MDSIGRIDQAAQIPIIAQETGWIRTFQRLVKRGLDFTLALLAILVLSPLLIALAFLVWGTSQGPVIFVQTRVGRGGKLFQIYKFRSMRADAEQLKNQLQQDNECDGPVFKIKNDPRVTQFGRFLRKFSLDELPQLFNVLMGDMSIVGPRPPLPEEVERYETWQLRRLSVPQGLTCFWQSSPERTTNFNEWV